MGATMLSAFSGMDNAVFSRLSSRNLLVRVMDANLPAVSRLFFLAASFRPNKARWGNAWYSSMVKSPKAFRARSKAIDNQLRRRLTEFDVVLQAGGLFSSFFGRFPKPVTIYCDYTTKLAERNYAPWFQMSERTARKWYPLETGLYEKCSKIFTASENTKRSLIEDYRVPINRVQVVREGVNEIHEHPDKDYREPTILFVGIDFKRKGGPALLQAFSQVRKQFPGAKLLIAGPDAMQQQDGVVWLGHIHDRGEMERLYSMASVFCMPSICEPFGLSLIEAMAHGLPVIASSSDAMPEIVEEASTGYLVAPDDVDSLAERLKLLLSSPQLCAKLGCAGRIRVKDQFLWEKVVDAIEAGLKEVCGHPLPQPAEN